MSSKTKNVVAPPSPEEQAYLQSQQALAQQQLALLQSQGTFQQDYLTAVQPVLDQQAQLLSTQLQQANSPEQQAMNQKLLDYQGSQIDLGQQQVALTQQELARLNDPTQLAIQQQAADYQLQQIQVAKQQLAMTQQQLDQINDPVQKQIQQRAADLQLEQLNVAEQQLQQQQAEYSSGAPLRDLQSQLLQKQLEQLNGGYAPTPEQLALIEQGSKSAIDSGNQNIDLQLAAFQHQNELQGGNIDAQSADALRQLRENLAPSLGLRPGDTPILDRGALVEREGLRLKGQLASDYDAASQQALGLKAKLASDIATQAANAKLNYPLSVAGMINGSSQFQQGLGLSTSQFNSGLTGNANAYPLTVTGAATQPISLGLNNSVTGNSLSTIGSANSAFQQQLAAMAAQNRMSLLGVAGNDVNSGLDSGNALATGIHLNPLSFPRTSTTTSKNPWGTTFQGFDTLANLMSGTGNLLAGASGGGGGGGGGGGAMSAMMSEMSDRRVKQNIKTLGFDSAGHRWVSFQYTGTKARKAGVIAQEAQKISPEAVFTNGLGLKYVDYSKLRTAA